MGSTSVREDDVERLRKERCMRLKLEELKYINESYLIASSIPTALFIYVIIMGHAPIIYYMASIKWFLPAYGVLGLIDLAWYVNMHHKCRRLVGSSLYECNSECYYQYCKDKYCYTEAYSSCIDMCKQIFNNTRGG